MEQQGQGQAAAGAQGQGAASPQEEEEDEGPKSWQRFYMGYHERFVDDCVLNLAQGPVRLAQAPSARAAQKQQARRSGQGTLDKAADPALTGTTVWDGAVVLSHLMADTDILGDNRSWRGLELGAGTGAVSLALLAARRVSSMTITDLPDLLPHLNLNLKRNMHLVAPTSRVCIKALHWGPPGSDLSELDEPFDLIVGSDLIYYSYSEATPHTKLLLWTLERLATPSTIIYLSLSLHHNPEEVEHFLLLAGATFQVERLRAEIPTEWRVPDVLVIRLRLNAGGAQGLAGGTEGGAGDTEGLAEGAEGLAGGTE